MLKLTPVSYGPYGPYGMANIVDISGALFMLRIQYEYTQTQWEEGARDVNNIWNTEFMSGS